MKSTWHFRKWFEILLKFITVFLGMCLLSICSCEFSIKSIIIIFGSIAICGLNIYLLKKYGRD